MGSLNSNVNFESSGFYDELHCHETANRRITSNHKENDEQKAMAKILLNCGFIGLKLNNIFDLLKAINQARVDRNANENFHARVMDSYSSQQMMEKEKLKASNFAATLLTIGSWQRGTKNEGDLVAKCYYAKKKMVWEFLERGLKSKIEIPWSDIIAMRADIQENKPGILELELSKPPTFHEETDPQPRKHTIWRLTTDFTGGEASRWRRHRLRFPPGSLDKHYEKLLKCDSRLHAISQQRFPSLNSPWFESNICGFVGFSGNFNVPGVPMNHYPAMQWPVSSFSQPEFVPNQLYSQPLMQPSSSAFRETRPLRSDDYGGNNMLENAPMDLWGGHGSDQGLQTTHRQLDHHYSDKIFGMNRVEGIDSIVPSVTPLDQNASYTQNYSLVPYKAAESSQPYLQSEMQEPFFNDSSLAGIYDNSYHQGVEPLNAPVDFAEVQKANSASESDQTHYRGKDVFEEENLDLEFEDASDRIARIIFGPFCDQNQQTIYTPSQLSNEDPTTDHHQQLLWNNSATFPYLQERLDEVGDEKQWS